jgi:hypothetical protein
MTLGGLPGGFVGGDNGCGLVGQGIQAMEQARGTIHVRSPGAAKFGWKI